MRPIVLFTVAVCSAARVASQCPSGAVEGVNPYDCFLLVSDDPQDQEDAWDGCWKRGGALASISSSRESYVVNSLVDVDKTGSYWIGASWDASDGINGAFSWMDNSPWNYTNWDKGTGLGNIVSSVRNLTFEMLFKGEQKVSNCSSKMAENFLRIINVRP